MKRAVLQNAVDGIRDDLLLDAMPPSMRAVIDVPRRTKPHPLRALGRALNSGVTAAVLSGIVAIGVLVAIVMAGRMTPDAPPTVTPAETGGLTEPNTEAITIPETVATESETLGETETIDPTIPMNVPHDCTVHSTVLVPANGAYLRISTVDVAPRATSPACRGLHVEILHPDMSVSFPWVTFVGYYTILAGLKDDGSTDYYCLGMRPDYDDNEQVFHEVSLKMNRIDITNDPHLNLTYEQQYDFIMDLTTEETLARSREQYPARFGEPLKETLGGLRNITIVATSDPLLTAQTDKEDISHGDALLSHYESLPTHDLSGIFFPDVPTGTVDLDIPVHYLPATDMVITAGSQVSDQAAVDSITGVPAYCTAIKINNRNGDCVYYREREVTEADIRSIADTLRKNPLHSDLSYTHHPDAKHYTRDILFESHQKGTLLGQAHLTFYKTDYTAYNIAYEQTVWALQRTILDYGALYAFYYETRTYEQNGYTFEVEHAYPFYLVMNADAEDLNNPFADAVLRTEDDALALTIKKDKYLEGFNAADDRVWQQQEIFNLPIAFRPWPDNYFENHHTLTMKAKDHLTLEIRPNEGILEKIEVYDNEWELKKVLSTMEDLEALPVGDYRICLFLRAPYDKASDGVLYREDHYELVTGYIFRLLKIA